VNAIENYGQKIMKNPLTLSADDQYFYCWAMQMDGLGLQNANGMSKASINQAHAYAVDVMLTHRLLDISQAMYAEAPVKNVGTMALKDPFHSTVRTPALDLSVKILKKAVSEKILLNPQSLYAFYPRWIGQEIKTGLLCSKIRSWYWNS
jgi:hypothetical protein